MILDETISEANSPAREFWKEFFCSKVLLLCRGWRWRQTLLPYYDSTLDLQGELLYTVEWEHFARAFSQWCELHAEGLDKDIYWRALRMVLIPGSVDTFSFLWIYILGAVVLLLIRASHIKDNENVVTLERFSAILEWFGPLTKGKKFLQNVASTIKIKYEAIGPILPVTPVFLSLTSLVRVPCCLLQGLLWRRNV